MSTHHPAAIDCQAAAREHDLSRSIVVGLFTSADHHDVLETPVPLAIDPTLEGVVV